MSTNNPNNPPDDGDTEQEPRAHENEDRPPIQPENPDRPAPFDPFSATVAADGGVTRSDHYENSLHEQLQQTVSPQTTDPSPSISGQGQTHPNAESPQRPSSVKREETIPHLDESEKEYDGSLIATIETAVENLQSNWKYELNAPTNPKTLCHTVYEKETKRYQIRRQNGEYYLCIYTRPDARSTETHEFSNFQNALAGLIEAIDWGTPPSSNSQIWEYEGYGDNYSSFIEYLSRQPNTEQDAHRFTNTSANYEIQITSNYPDSQTSDPITVLTIFTQTENHQQIPLYRAELPGQQDAFNFTLALLDENISREIHAHDAHLGPVDDVPSLEEFY